MIFENSQVCERLGIPMQSLKKIRSILVNDFGILSRGQKIDDEILKLIEVSVDYVRQFPGSSYKTGLNKAIEAQKLEKVNVILSASESEDAKNYDMLEKRYPELWSSYVLMTTTLADLAKEKGFEHISKLVNATLDTVAAELGAALRNE